MLICNTREMQNEFDLWNEQKKELATLPDRPRFYPHEGEVWMSTFGKNIGFEENGSGDSFSRPVLIVRRFGDQMFLIVPLSSQQKDIWFYYNFTEPDGRPASALLVQMKLMSVKRLRRKLFRVSAATLTDIKDNLKQIFEQ